MYNPKIETIIITKVVLLEILLLIIFNVSIKWNKYVLEIVKVQNSKNFIGTAK